MTTDLNLNALLAAMMPDTLVRMHDNALDSIDVDAAEAIRRQLVALVGEDEAQAMLAGCEVPGPEKVANDEALTAFMVRTAQARAHLEALTAYIDDHAGVLPEDVDWANVGDMAHVAELLKEAADFIGNEVEVA